MKTAPKAKMALLSSLALGLALTAFEEVAADTNSRTTNFGGSRPMDSGIRPSTPLEGGTVWMANTNRSSEGSNAPAVGGTGPGSTTSSGRATSVDLNNLGWLGLLGLAGLLGLLARQFEARED